MSTDPMSRKSTWTGIPALLTLAIENQFCKEYIKYYNHGKPSQALNAIFDPYPELKEPPPIDGAIVSPPILGGIHYDYRLVA